ncbi:DUF1543 domain-containing protein [Pseudomonas sp. HR96]|uniref:DUF1543 domain-containing protein n=1 Tax=Pseudomonas sp. HR96 TaxID=1027966 RepID=UPI002A75C4B6|nr:DUF1543 domain-containing protein [Pseudomonas sp. HR96]WPP02141.1 DUF1543 domain-containing protein [Pseudomonas sp. HR96]
MLFVVMLGGKHPRANIEVHDVVFVLAERLDQAYPQLREAWFGSAKGVHIDAWMAVDGVAGWQVRMSDLAPGPDEPRLYFINLGGYEPGAFGEAHRYELVVARNKTEAKAQARAGMRRGWQQGHLDALLDVDDCIPIDQVGGRYVQLVQGAHAGVQVRSDYIVLS